MSDLVTQFTDFINDKKSSFSSETIARNEYIEEFSKKIIVKDGVPIIPNIYEGESLRSILNKYKAIYPDTNISDLNILRTDNSGEFIVSGEEVLNVLKEYRDFNNISDKIWSTDEIINALKICTPEQQELPTPKPDDVLFAATCIQPSPASSILETNPEIDEFTFGENEEDGLEEDGLENISLDDSLNFLDSLKTELKTTKRYKVFSNTTGVITEVVDIGVYESGYKVIVIDDKVVPVFFNTSNIIELYVKVGDSVNIGTPLYFAEELGEDIIIKEIDIIKEKVEKSNQLQKYRNEEEMLKRKLDIFTIFYGIHNERYKVSVEYEKNPPNFTIEDDINLSSYSKYVNDIYTELEKWTSEVSVDGEFIENVDITKDFGWNLDLLKNINGEVLSDSAQKRDATGIYWDINNELVSTIEELEKDETFQDNLLEEKTKTNEQITAALLILGNKLFNVVENLVKREYLDGISSIAIKESLDFWEKRRNEIQSELDKITTKIADTENFIKDPGEKIENVPFTIKQDDNQETKVVFYPMGDDTNAEVDEDLEWRGNPRPNNISPQMTDIRWWRRFCQNATIMNLIPIFWPVGLIIPSPAGPVRIPLPIIWTPIKVITLPTGIIAIGLGICGLAIAPWVAYINTTPVSIGVIGPNSSWLIGGIRPMKKIKDDQGTKVGPLNATINIGGFKININPLLSQTLPFIQDDFPPWERLSLKNLPHLLFLTEWCAAGKKSQGFFENIV